MAMSAPPVLLLIDSQPLFLEGLAGLLQRAWPDRILKSARDFPTGRATLEEGRVEGVLANWETLRPGEFQELISLSSPAPVIVTTHNADEDIISQAFGAGARGVLPKTMGGEAVKSAIIVALNGGACFPTHALPLFGEARQRTTIRFQGQRQFEVLERLERGMSNKEIARELALSVATVKLHVQTILRSTGARSRFEAVSNARRMGLLPQSA